MAYRLRTNVLAERDMIEAAELIAYDSPGRARRWFTSLRQRLREIPEAPFSFTLIPEWNEIGIPLRQFHFHSHRIVFRIQ